MSGKTWFFGQLGDLLFPFTRPSGPGSSNPGTIDNTTIGSSTPRPGSFTNLSASGPTTINQLLRGETALSTGAAANPQGILTVGSTSAKTFTLGANVVGGDVNIVCTANGTASKKVKAASGVTILGFLSSAAGSSHAKTSLNFTGLGQSCWMRALSSSVLQVVSKSGNVVSS